MWWKRLRQELVFINDCDYQLIVAITPRLSDIRTGEEVGRIILETNATNSELCGIATESMFNFEVECRLISLFKTDLFRACPFQAFD